MFDSGTTRGLRIRALTMAVSACAFLGACGPKKDIDAATPDVAAKVNGDDIGVAQVDLALQHLR
ncbi:MAG: hypothetical protein ABW032_06615, partial [Burkholderiaceae bacterium]